MVAPDWRGSKGNYREWQKMKVERLLAGLNCDVRERVEKSNPPDAKRGVWSIGFHPPGWESGL